MSCNWILPQEKRSLILTNKINLHKDVELQYVVTESQKAKGKKSVTKETGMSFIKKNKSCLGKINDYY